MGNGLATNGDDALVIFGATSHLSNLGTFPALVELVNGGMLVVAVIGSPRRVGHGPVPRLHGRAAEAQRMDQAVPAPPEC
jgi:hypothetical protein